MQVVYIVQPVIGSIKGIKNIPKNSEIVKGQRGLKESGAPWGVGIPKMENKGYSAGARTIANNLNEQLAMKQVKSNPLAGATEIPIKMTDSRWLGTDGWVKMQNIVTLSDGTKINIHFVYNKALNLVDDFKFK